MMVRFSWRTSTLRILEDRQTSVCKSGVRRVDVINKVSGAMDAKDLIEMNRQSTVEAQSASAIASKWLESKGLPHK